MSFESQGCLRSHMLCLVARDSPNLVLTRLTSSAGNWNDLRGICIPTLSISLRKRNSCRTVLQLASVQKFAGNRLFLWSNFRHFECGCGFRNTIVSSGSEPACCHRCRDCTNCPSYSHTSRLSLSPGHPKVGTETISPQTMLATRAHPSVM